MVLVTDTDKSQGYEVNSLKKSVTNAVLVPILNSLPVSIRKYLKRSHKAGKEIIEHATTHKALDILYGYGSAREKQGVIHDFFNSVWLSTSNAKAVRNRLRLVKREIKEQIIRLALEGKEIRIASIASGSARAITESLTEASLKDGVKVSATFVDKNPLAIEYSKELAAGHPYRDSFKWVNDAAGNFFRRHLADTKLDIVEIVGLIDYFNDEDAQRLFSLVYEILEKGGMLITANISDNSEKEFIDRVLGWKMIYRSAEQLAEVVKRAGFSEEKMKIVYEPLKIHCVIVAHK